MKDTVVKGNISKLLEESLEECSNEFGVELFFKENTKYKGNCWLNVCSLIFNCLWDKNNNSDKKALD